MRSVKFLCVGLFCSLLTLLCGTEPKPDTPQAHHVSVLRQLLDLSFRDTNWNLLNEFVDENVVIHGLGLTGDDQVGINSSRENQQLAQESFQQVGLEIHELFARDDRVIISWTWHLVHVGEYLGIPATQKTVTVSGINMYRFNDEGKICEIWGSFDKLAIMKQIADISINPSHT